MLKFKKYSNNGIGHFLKKLVYKFESNRGLRLYLWFNVKGWYFIF